MKPPKTTLKTPAFRHPAITEGVKPGPISVEIVMKTSRGEVMTLVINQI